MRERLLHIAFQLPRILKYKLLSSNRRVDGKPILNSPCLMSGLGEIKIAKNVSLGVKSSPFFYNTYIYLEARSLNAKIKIEEGVFINNNASIIADHKTIHIKKNTLIGFNCSIIDSDFHSLNPSERTNGTQKTASVVIEENVFIGNNVTILKGVTIGENAVVANGAIVTKDVSANTVVGGVPAKVIKQINEANSKS